MQCTQALGVSFQSVNRWERSKTKPLPIVLKQIEVMVKEMGDRPATVARALPISHNGAAIATQLASRGQAKKVGKMIRYFPQ